MKTQTRRPRGRPRTRENTMLTATMIDRQDGMSRRSERRIREILDSHVPREHVEIAWRGICRRTRTVLEALPTRIAARVPTLGTPAAIRLLDEEIQRILAEMGAPPDDGAPLPALLPPDEPPTARPSRSLPAARAQSARLGTYLSDLRERLAPYAPPNGPRQIYLAGSPVPRDGNTNAHPPSPTATVGEENAS